MSFNGTEGGAISLQHGAALTAEYRRQNPGATKGHFFGKDILQELLNQEGCMGIRMYYGIDGDGNKELVLVGADADQNDLTDLVADLSMPCPSICGNGNALNS